MKKNDNTAAFDLTKALAFVWEGDTVYDESLMLMRDADGNAQAPLLYDPEKVLSVTSAAGDEIYTEGEDYTVTEHGIALTAKSGIFCFEQEELYPNDARAGETFPTEGGNLLFREGTFFHERQVSVTYRAKEKKEPIFAPQSAASFLARSHRKLNEGHLTLCVYGDSISVGANASGYTGISPHCPPYAELFCKGLRARYNAEVEFINPSKGGMDSKWGAENASELAAPHKPDLAVIAFGANDAGRPTEDFISNIKAIMTEIRKTSPDCDFILISTSMPNILLSSDKARFYANQGDFEEPLLALAEPGVAVADITEMQRRILTKKRFIDLTGNNVNHPNDFFHRLYAQYLLAPYD